MVSLLPASAECHGLLALLLLHDSRRPARVSANGQLVPLEEQRRECWDQDAIANGLSHLDTALMLRSPGPYQLQAAIAALHAQATEAAATDWRQIALLYMSLLRHLPTPVVELNAAVAIAMAGDLDAGLAWMDRLAERGELADYHLLPAARAGLLRRAGRLPDAALAYQAAIEQCKNASEREYLRRQIAVLTLTNET